MTKHTPGPFHAEVPPSSSGYCRSIYALRDEGPDVFVAYVGNWKQPPETEIADTALFVAAPDMLAALESVAEWCDLIEQNYPEMRFTKQVRAALEKVADA